MKSGDAVTLSTLRLLLAAIHNEEIKLQRELRLEEIHRIIATLCKQRGEAIDLYRKGNRDDLARKEEAELEQAVLKAVRPDTDYEPLELAKTVHDKNSTVSEDLVLEAIWRLISEGKIQLSSHRKLRASR